MKEKVGINLNNPPLEIKHADLTRLSEDSIYKSVCPKCSEGSLLLRRDSLTWFLRNYDNCILCGQHVIYTDIPDNKVFSIEELNIVPNEED